MKTSHIKVSPFTVEGEIAQQTHQRGRKGRAGYVKRYLQKATNSAPECSVMKKWQKLNQKDNK